MTAASSSSVSAVNAADKGSEPDNDHARAVAAPEEDTVHSKCSNGDDNERNDESSSSSIDKALGAPGSSNDTAIRNMGLWRMIFFCIMMYEWSHDQVLTPFGKLDLKIDLSNGAVGIDRWFAYNQFEWIQELHLWLGQDSDRAFLLNNGGYLLCFMAAFGKEIRLPGWRWYTSLFTFIYLIRFLAKATNFTNHNYLFPLLMILTIFSGGGKIILPGTRVVDTPPEQKTCQSAIVAMRAQLALMYLFAALWKLHGDWLAGRIVRRIFLSFQQTNKARGIPWDAVEEVFPQIFVGLAIGGFFLDACMAAVLLFGKPTTSSTKIFLAFTLVFHLSTSLTMAQMIGYSFPGTCIAALTLFLPMTVQQSNGKVIPYDKSLVSWLYRYALDLPFLPDNESDPPKGKQPALVTPLRWQKFFTLLWTLWQLYMPLRMLVLSKGSFPYNRIAYRYSWTMMLHDLEFGIIRKQENGPDTVLLLAYFVPTCFLRGQPDMYMPRTLYLGPQSEHPMQDTRTAPMHKILGNRQSKMLEVFPSHLIHRVGAGVASTIDAMVGERACAQINLPESVLPENPRMGMHAVYFGRLNGNGPYSRLIDPTVDLVSVMEAQRSHSYAKTLSKAFLDDRPNGYEFVLGQGIGSFRQAAKKYATELKLHFPDKTVQFISDRASCLHARPLWLSPMGNPYGFIPLRLPYGTSLYLKSNGPTAETRELDLAKLAVVSSTSLEMGIRRLDTTKVLPCGQTLEEDVLIAVLY